MLNRQEKRLDALDELSEVDQDMGRHDEKLMRLIVLY